MKLSSAKTVLFLLIQASGVVAALEKRENFLLNALYEKFMEEPAALLIDPLDQPLRLKGDGLLLVQALLSDGAGTNDGARAALEKLGGEVTACGTYSCSLYMPLQMFLEFEALPEVSSIMPEYVIHNQAGSLVSEALQSLQVDQVRSSDPTLNGSGLTIGILSDSFDNSITAVTPYADDIASSDLPAGIRILKEGPQGIDEGRAMAQLVHDLVPGASLVFRTAFEGQDDFAAGSQELADAGCDVIVDDIGYLNEPFFQDGVIAQSANDVAQLRNTPYFSSAGNSGSQSFEGTFVDSGTLDIKGCKIHDFGNGDTLQEVTLSEGSVFILQWDDPFFSVSGAPGASRDLDIALFFGTDAVAESLTINAGSDPFEGFLVPFTGIFDIQISFCDTINAPAPFFKWIVSGSARDIEYDTVSSTSFGHPNTPFTAGVGAAFFQDTPVFGTDPPQLESFSSRGGTPILFERDGNRKATPEVREQPRFTATDGCINTFFGQRENFQPNGLGFYFFGTSAAAPNAAAVAILLLQVRPTLTPMEIYQVMEATTIDMGTAGFDFLSGHGLVDANAAVALVTSQSPSSGPSFGPSSAPSSGPSSALSSSPSRAPSVSPSSAPSSAPVASMVSDVGTSVIGGGLLLAGAAALTAVVRLLPYILGMSENREQSNIHLVRL